jgi:hypothetical protein
LIDNQERIIVSDGWWWISPAISPLLSPSIPLDGQNPAYFPSWVEKNPAQYDFCPTWLEHVPEYFPPHGVEYGRGVTHRFHPVGWTKKVT